MAVFLLSLGTSRSTADAQLPDLPEEGFITIMNVSKAA
jgi:hypothetical protein